MSLLSKKDPPTRTNNSTERGHGAIVETAAQHLVREVPTARADESVGVILMKWLLSQVGKDPAFGSGPVATIIQDVLSLFIYFTLISLLV